MRATFGRAVQLGRLSVAGALCCALVALASPAWAANECLGQPAGHVCRAAAGPCDVADTCDGTAPDCGLDLVQPNAFTCHKAGGVCDPNGAQCDGIGPACPITYETSGTVCGFSTSCNADQVCDGAGACVEPCEDGAGGQAGAGGALATEGGQPMGGASAGAPAGGVGGVGVEPAGAGGAQPTTESGDMPAELSAGGAGGETGEGDEYARRRPADGDCSCRVGSAGSVGEAFAGVLSLVALLAARRRR